MFSFVLGDVLIDKHFEFFIDCPKVAFRDVAELFKGRGFDTECEFRQL